MGDSKKCPNSCTNWVLSFRESIISNWKWFHQTQHNVVNKRDFTEGIELLRVLRKICLNPPKNYKIACNSAVIATLNQCDFWPHCKSNSGLWIEDVCPSVCLSVSLSVRLSTFWLTSAFKFVLRHINQYRLDTWHGNRPWWDLLNCDLSLWPWLFLFKVT